jgi:hypothetical protein
LSIFAVCFYVHIKSGDQVTITPICALGWFRTVFSMTRPLSPVMHIVAPGESCSPPGGNGWFRRLTVEQVLHDGSAPVLRNLIAVPTGNPDSKRTGPLGESLR